MLIFISKLKKQRRVEKVQKHALKLQLLLQRCRHQVRFDRKINDLQGQCCNTNLSVCNAKLLI